ncbi:MAG TPA: hypothetical protein VM658_16250 [bacterium]|nr:hypothetical protein [bacterium]
MRIGDETLYRAIIAAALAVLMLGAGSCVPGTDQSEDKPIDFLETSGGGIYLVDGYGTRSPLPYTYTGDTLGHPYYIDGLLMLNNLGLFELSRDGRIIAIDFTSRMGKTLHQLQVPGGRGIIKARLGWAGNRLYVLTDTDQRGVMLEEFDVFGGDTVIAGPFDDLGAGLEDPVSFDLANGGSQIYLLYASGRLMAHSLYTYQEPEGLVADFGPGAKDVQALPDGRIYVGGDKGVFRMAPGQAPELLTNPGPVKLVRVKRPDAEDVFAATTDESVYRYLPRLDLNYLYLTNPDQVTGLTSVDDPWVQNTKPLIEDPWSVPPYYTFFTNPYFLYFQDPEGNLADVTAVIYSDTVQGAFFVGTLSDDTVITFPGVPAGNGLNAKFFGGYTPGQMTIHIEAASADGQLSVRDLRLTVESFVP